MSRDVIILGMKSVMMVLEKTQLLMASDGLWKLR